MRLKVFFIACGIFLGSESRAWAEKILTDSRSALTLVGGYEYQVAIPDPVTGLAFITKSSGLISNGGAFAQVEASSLSHVKGCTLTKSPDMTYLCSRLRIWAAKPVNAVATLAVQAPGGDASRTFRVTALVGVPYAELFLNEISLDDYGQIALQLVVVGGTSASYGLLDLRTYDVPPAQSASVSVQVNSVPVVSGSTAKTGWWFLFMGPASKINLTSDPTELLSLCAEMPSGDFECSEGNEMHFRAREKGTYHFTAWTKQLAFSEFVLEGV